MGSVQDLFEAVSKYSRPAVIVLPPRYVHMDVSQRLLTLPTTGNFRRLTDRLGSEQWAKQLVERYGPIAKLSAPFGVSIQFDNSTPMSLPVNLQRTWLHVYDPKALYSITIKDQEFWEKSMSKFKYVRALPLRPVAC